MSMTPTKTTPKFPTPPSMTPMSATKAGGAQPSIELGFAELIAWLTLTMGKADEAIRAQMQDVNDRKELSQKLREILTEVQEVKTSAEVAEDKGWGVNEGSQIAKMQWSFNGSDAKPAWFEKLSGPTKEAFEKFFGDLKGDGRAHLTSINRLEKTLTDEMANISSGNELKMIGLQTEMGRRNNAIEQTSNILAAMQRSLDKIVGNLN